MKDQLEVNPGDEPKRSLVARLETSIREAAEPVQNLGEPVQKLGELVQELVQKLGQWVQKFGKLLVQKLGQPVQILKEPAQKLRKLVQILRKLVQELRELVQKLEELVQKLSIPGWVQICPEKKQHLITSLVQKLGEVSSKASILANRSLLVPIICLSFRVPCVMMGYNIYICACVAFLEILATVYEYMFVNCIVALLWGKCEWFILSIKHGRAKPCVGLHMN